MATSQERVCDSGVRFRYIKKMISPACVRLLHAQPDDRLLALAREGHERAFEALVQRYRERLLAHCKRVLPAARAEDAVQQGLLQAWLALQRGTDVRDVKPWLYQIVHNTAIRMQRSPAADQAQLTDTLAAPGTPHSDLERQIAARDALEQVAALPELQREVLLQTAVRGRTNDQVATALGLSNGSVRGLLYRARTKLRAAAGGLIPSPLVMWAMRVVGKRAPSPPGSGSTAEVGIAAILGKGGAVAVTVTVLAVGGRAVHSHLWPADTLGAGHYSTRLALDARTARSRVDADRAEVDRTTGSRILMAARSGANARGIRSSGTTPGGGHTSVADSDGWRGDGSVSASSAPRRINSSHAPTSTSAGDDGGNGGDSSESGGPHNSATAHTGPADASTDTGGDHTSSESSDASDGSPTSARRHSRGADNQEESD